MVCAILYWRKCRSCNNFCHKKKEKNATSVVFLLCFSASEWESEINMFDAENRSCWKRVYPGSQLRWYWEPNINQEVIQTKHTHTHTHTQNNLSFITNTNIYRYKDRVKMWSYNNVHCQNVKLVTFQIHDSSFFHVQIQPDFWNSVRSWQVWEQKSQQVPGQRTIMSLYLHKVNDLCCWFWTGEEFTKTVVWPVSADTGIFPPC